VEAPVEASLQLSFYSYATAMNGLADEADLRLRFDVLTKTRQPVASLLDHPRPRGECPTAPDGRRGAQRRRGRRVPPRVGWHCQDCSVRSRCWAWGE
jgi:hypothetical protein